MFRVVLLFSLVALTASACGPNGGAPTPEGPPAEAEIAHSASASGSAEAPTDTVAVNASPTSGPTKTSSPLSLPGPTEITTTLTALSLAGSQVSYNGTSFWVDPVLGEVVSMRVAAGPPEYTEFSFGLEGDCDEVGCVTVYLVAAFREYPFGDDIMDGLEAAIESGSDNFFPTWGSAILLRAQTRHLRFQNGAGMRATVMRAQNGYFANNQALVYDFHGLTDDGQYYLEVKFPLDAPMLLSTYDPDENTNENAIPVPEIPADDPFDLFLNEVMLAYNQEAQRQLDALGSSGFIPDLGTLDALVGSLLVTAPPEE